MGPIHPEENRYNWTPADKIVGFAQKNGKLLRGHTLCWHNQTPSCFFQKDGRKVTKEELLARLKTHITDAVTRYKGKVYAWDVYLTTATNCSARRNFIKLLGKNTLKKILKDKKT